MKNESKKKRAEEDLWNSFRQMIKKERDVLVSKIIEGLDSGVKKQFGNYYIEEMIKHVLSLCLDPLIDFDFQYLYSSFKEKFDPVIQRRGISSEVMLKAILRTAKNIYKK